MGHDAETVAARFAETSALEGLGVVVVNASTVGQFGWERTNLPARLRFPIGWRWEPAKPLPIPEVVVDVPAGVPSPRTGSAWKINAVRLATRLRAGELLTSADIEAQGISFTRARFMLEDSGERRGRAFLWRLAPSASDVAFDRRWPEIREALSAKDEAA